MAKQRRGGLPRTGRALWIVMACCALGAITFIALLLGGEIEGARVAPSLDHATQPD